MGEVPEEPEEVWEAGAGVLEGPEPVGWLVGVEVRVTPYKKNKGLLVIGNFVFQGICSEIEK